MTMASRSLLAFRENVFSRTQCSSFVFTRNICATSLCNSDSSGRYKPIEGRKQLLTYDQALPPHEIAHKKSWNSWNTSNLRGGRRSALTNIEDIFIRRFLYGSWFSNVVGEQIIIKRQHNLIRIAICVSKQMSPQTMYFITGFSEEMLSIWLHCPVKLEIQVVERYEGFVKIV